MKPDVDALKAEREIQIMRETAPAWGDLLHYLNSSGLYDLAKIVQDGLAGHNKVKTRLAELEAHAEAMDRDLAFMCLHTGADLKSHNAYLAWKQAQEKEPADDRCKHGIRRPWECKECFYEKEPI